MEIETLVTNLLAYGSRVFGPVLTPWLIYQVVIILALYGLSLALSNRIEPKLEERARAVRGHPGLLRVVVAFLRRLEWVIFIGLAIIALAVLRSVTWPSRSYLISVALSLSVVWLFVSVLSRIVRNRLIAKTISWLAWIYAALVIVGIDAHVGNFLDSLAFPVGNVRLSVLTLMKGTILLISTLWVAVVVGRYLDERLQRVEELTPALRVLVGKIAKIGLVLIAGFGALSAVGIDLTIFTVFSGAIGLGLGFGLQKVISNFISGIIILLDRSIKPGDTISLEGTFGWIRELRGRFVSVVTRDGREYLIPNEDFITGRVINWSFSDDFVRLDVNFGVSYDADPHEVTRLAIEAAMSVGRVTAERRPVCWLTGFGESSLDFVLRFWISDPQQGLTNVRGKVLLALWDAFKEHGVGIPYPHREVILKTPLPEQREAPMD